MKRVLSSMAAGLVMAGFFAAAAFAQEAPAPVATRSGLMHEPHIISTGIDFAGKFLRDGSSADKNGCEAPAEHGTRFTVGGQIQWQDLTQLQYFGRGSESAETDRSDFRLTTLETSGFVRYRPLRSLALESSVGFLNAPKIRSSAGFDAFRAGGYTRAEARPFIERIAQKIAGGRALQSPVGGQRP